MVPVTAVRTGANGDFVYVINDDRTVTLRKVRRGQSTVEWVAIAEGLKPGERVVTEGGDRLKDGVKVQLQGQAPGGQRPDGAQGRRARGSEPQGGEGRRHRQQQGGGGSAQEPASAAAPAAPTASQPAAR